MLGVDAKEIVRNSLAHIEARTCVRFSEISQPTNSSHISFGLGTRYTAFCYRFELVFTL